MKKLGIYIHIPFCRRKCNYCGFYSKPVDFSDSADDEKAPKTRGLVDACVQAPEISYVQRLVATIRERGEIGRAHV